MRRLLGKDKKRKDVDANAIHQQRAVEPDEETKVGNRPLSIDGQSSLPRNWAKERSGSRRSLGRRSHHSSDSPRSTTSSGKVSLADYDDMYNSEMQVQMELNPDVEHQIDADEQDFDTYNLPKPGTVESSGRKGSDKKTKKEEKQAVDRFSRRLSTRMTKLVTKKGSKKKTETIVEEDTNEEETQQQQPPKQRSSITRQIMNTGKRLSFRRPPSAARLAKQQEKKEQKEEAKRLKELKKNPWFPAGVNFRYLSPKSKWVPYLGHEEEVDFGNEARLIGVAM